MWGKRICLGFVSMVLRLDGVDAQSFHFRGWWGCFPWKQTQNGKSYLRSHCSPFPLI
jgi:hypothetical protein